MNRVVWRSEKISDKWETGITYPIFNKGNPAETNNYRGIYLLDIGCKILTAIILKIIN